VAEKLELKVGDKLYIVTRDNKDKVQTPFIASVLKVGTKFFYINVNGIEMQIPLTVTFSHTFFGDYITIFLTKEDLEEKDFRIEFNWKVKNKNFDDIPLEKLKEVGEILGLWRVERPEPKGKILGQDTY
jgi:hypothetical protein